MPICQNCRHTWSWKDCYRGTLLFKNKMNCPYCGKKQYLSAKTRKRASFMSMLPLIPLFLTSIFNLSLYFYIGLSIVLFSGFIAAAPFFYELSNEEEALW